MKDNTCGNEYQLPILKRSVFRISGILLLAIVTFFAKLNYVNAQQAHFTHPGIPLSAADLDTLKSNIVHNRYPWKQAFDQLAADAHSSLGYQMQGPFANVSRAPNVNLNQWRNDMTACWDQALMWYFTGNEAYAVKAKDILLAWATTQTSFTGGEAQLDLGDYAYAFGGAASILRGSWSGWTAEYTDAVKNLFNNVYWVSAGFRGYLLGPANKGALSMVTGAVVAAFSDDQQKIDTLIYVMRNSASSGFLNTLPSGEIGESGRDQGHAHGTLVSYAMAAEILWKQGIDMFSERDNRLLAASEYFSRKNEGVPQGFITFGATDALYVEPDKTPIWGGGNTMLAIMEGAYHVRKGLQTPYTSLHLSNIGRVNGAFFYKTMDNSTAAIVPNNVTYAGATLIGTGLTGTEVGHTAIAGSSNFDNNVWTLTGSGKDLWTHGNDAHYYLYKQLTGNFSVIARVDTITNNGMPAKAGVMIRSSLDSNASIRVWTAATVAPGVEAYNHGWSSGGIYGGSNWESRSRVFGHFPYWVKIERIGDIISTYLSTDGASWAVMTEARYNDFVGNTYVGLAVSSASDTSTVTAKFSNVSITGGTGGTVTIPAAPHSVYVSPGNGQVQLRWLSAFGAAGYNVKRGNGQSGPFTTIATDVSGNSFFDNTVTNGQTYYYTVSAENSAGESPLAPAAPAVPNEGFVDTILHGIYKVVAQHSGKVLSVRGASMSEGALVEQSTYSGAANQHWLVAPLGDNKYRISNMLSGKYLDVVGDGIVNGSNIDQSTGNEDDSSQVWVLNNRGNNTFGIIGEKSGKALDISNGSTADGAGAALYNWTDGSNQVFAFLPVSKEDMFAALRAKIAEATQLRDTTMPTANGELGKYPDSTYHILDQDILYVQANFDEDTTSVMTALQFVSMLDTDINVYKKSYLYERNALLDGDYYIKPLGGDNFLTKGTGNTPIFDVENTVSNGLQRWSISKDSNGRYKISNIDGAPASFNNFLNENAQFSTNAYYPAWNTMNIYFNGTGYAIQRAESAGNGYWYPSGDHVQTEGSSISDTFPYFSHYSFALIPVAETLPVGLTNFKASRKNNVYLSWQMGAGRKIEGFNIQKSLNGIDWLQIASVRSSDIGNYNYIDTLQPSKQDRIYYRLEIRDNNGVTEYSNIVSLAVHKAEDISLFPNPVHDYFYINGLHSKGSMSLFDANGRLVMKKDLSQVRERVDLKGISDGIYFIKILTDTQTIKKQILKTAK